MVYIKLKTVANEKEVLDFLFNINEVTRLENCSGGYDIQTVFTVRSEEEFTNSFDNITNKYYNIIHSYDILEILDEDFLGINFLLDNIDDKNFIISEHKGSTFEKEFKKVKQEIQKKPPVDEKDKEILEILKLNGRISIKDLSNKLNISSISIENRIKKLILSQVIKGFFPIASVSKLGYQWWYVLYKFKNINKNKFFAYLKYNKNIPWCMKLLGKWDCQFSIFAKNNSEFHKILDNIRSEFSENIISYDSIIVFNQFKYIQRVV